MMQAFLCWQTAHPYSKREIKCWYSHRRSSSPSNIRKTPDTPNLVTVFSGRQTFDASHVQTSIWSIWPAQIFPCWSLTSTNIWYTPGHSVFWDLNIAVVSENMMLNKDIIKIHTWLMQPFLSQKFSTKISY